MHTPLTPPVVERLTGIIRSKFVGYAPFWIAVDLERKLADLKL